MSNTPYIVQWGILGCGWISSEFVQDICRPLAPRGVNEISHAVAAVGSRSLPKAQEFIAKFCPDGAAAQIEGLVDNVPQAYGSYREVVNDKNVKIVYVGTMNTAHFEDAKLALDAGKHCLLEKPATLNAMEWKTLSTLAKTRGVFLMEAVWTRFNPCLKAIEKAIHEDRIIGDIRCLYSDNAADLYDKVPDTHRILAAELAGGTLLDLGPYPLVWTMMMLFRHPDNHRTPPAKVGSTMMLSRTGVDLASSVTLTFPSINAIAYLTTNAMSTTPKSQHTRIVGTKGEILISGYNSRPVKYVVRKLADPVVGGKFLPDEEIDLSFDGFGLYWEADEVARCLKNGLLECPRMPHMETQMTMEIFDKVREEGGYRFLPGLEKVK